MASEDLDLIRRIYEVFDDDIESLIELCSDEVEWISPLDAVDSGTRTGKDGVRAAFARTAEAFVGTRHDPVDFVAGTEGRVLVPVIFHARGRGSGVELHQPEWHVWTVLDGRAGRFEWFRQAAAGARAAGLEPSA